MALTVVACTTMEKRKLVRFTDAPPAVVDLFRSCHNLNGAFSFTIQQPGSKTLFFDFEFQTSTSSIAQIDHWAIEISDPSAQSLAQVRFDSETRKIITTGSFASKVPRLSLNEQNFLFVDDEFTGIKVDEWPCLLKSKIPSNWRADFLEGPTLNEKVFESRVSEDKRKILTSIKLPSAGGNQLISICHDISWRTHLGLIGHVITFCNQYSEAGSRGTISVLDFKLDWEDIDR